MELFDLNGWRFARLIENRINIVVTEVTEVIPRHRCGTAQKYGISRELSGLLLDYIDFRINTNPTEYESH